jgi:hypothetical protein
MLVLGALALPPSNRSQVSKRAETNACAVCGHLSKITGSTKAADIVALMEGQHDVPGVGTPPLKISFGAY